MHQQFSAFTYWFTSPRQERIVLMRANLSPHQANPLHAEGVLLYAELAHSIHEAAMSSFFVATPALDAEVSQAMPAESKLQCSVCHEFTLERKQTMLGEETKVSYLCHNPFCKHSSSTTY